MNEISFFQVDNEAGEIKSGEWFLGGNLCVSEKIVFDDDLEMYIYLVHLN